MSESILVTGDMVVFLPPFGNAVVVPVPGVITGSGKCNATKNPVCVEGDEGQVIVPGCPYIAPPYIIPGAGNLKIDSLDSGQKSEKSKSGGKVVLLVGTGKQFNAKFEVLKPAQLPPPPGTPDSVTSYSGKGMFVSMNMLVRAK